MAGGADSMLHCHVARLTLALAAPACLPPRPVQPLTLASIGRRLWIKYRFTNKRLVITTNSPVLKREVQVRQWGGHRWLQLGWCKPDVGCLTAAWPAPAAAAAAARPRSLLMLPPITGPIASGCFPLPRVYKNNSAHPTAGGVQEDQGDPVSPPRRRPVGRRRHLPQGRLPPAAGGAGAAPRDCGPH